MGITLTDVLLFGKAQLADVDKATLVIYRRNILRWSALGGYLDIIVKGVSPLSLPDAIANSLEYLKAFGGTEQRNLPDGYTELEYIESSGTQYIDTGIVPNEVDNLYIKFKNTTTNDGYLIGAANGSLYNYVGIYGSAFNGYGENWGDGGNFKRFDIPADTTNIHTIEVDLTSTPEFYFDGVLKATQSVYATISSTSTFIINENIYGSPTRRPHAQYYEVKLSKNNALVQDLVPVKRNSDNELGMYDTVTGNFLTNAGTGDFTAGADVVPTPDTPMDIISNNGALKARHQSGLPLGYTELEYIHKTGVAFIDTGINQKEGIGLKVIARFATYNSGYQYLVGTYTAGDYIGIWKDNASTLKFCYKNAVVSQTTTDTTDFHTMQVNYLNDKKFMYDDTTVDSITETKTATSPAIYIGDTNFAGTFSSTFDIKEVEITDQNSVVAHYIPVKRDSDNEIGMYNILDSNPATAFKAKKSGDGSFTAGSTVSDPIEIYTDGTVETITDALSNTATTEMLLKVGDYQDVQSIIDGAVTRKVGVKVLNGTENFETATATNCYSLTNTLGTGNFADRTIVCSHFASTPTMPDTGDRQGLAFIVNKGAEYTIAFGATTQFSTQALWQQFLADQYAAGTPVIIVYPLATATTESVAGQAMQVQQGDNIVEVTQASIDNLELEAKYQAAVSLTIQEVQDANLDPNVQVTIN